MSEISASEQAVCEFLAPLVRSSAVGGEIVIPPADGYVFSPLEFFLSGVLREVHAEWRHESLDGIYPQLFCKTEEREIDLVGVVSFISDQSLAPLHLRLQLTLACDRVSWVDLRLGERMDGECRRNPYGSLDSMQCLVERLEAIDWYYHVGYDEREA